MKTDARQPGGVFRAVPPLLVLAVPMLVGQAGQVLMQMTDTLMVGHLGAVPLAGAALAGNFLMFALYFAYGSLGAVAPRIARAFGAGDDGGVGAASRAGMILAFRIGIFVALCLTLAVPFLGRLGQPEEVVRITGGYLFLLAWSLPAALASLVFGQTAEAVNRPWPVVGFMAGALVLNGLLNYLLIFGHFGFPALGLAGSGWATLTARVVQAIAMGIWVWRGAGMRKFLVFQRRTDRPLLRSLLRDGLPVAGQDVLEGGSFAIGSLMMGWVGVTALAANQVTISIASLAWMFPIALSLAAGVRVAQAMGAGDLAAARRSGIAGVVVGAGLMSACAVIYVMFGRTFAGMFTSDREVAALAGTLVTIAGVYQISDAIQSVSLGSLRGLLDNRVPLVANAVCYWVLCLPTVYFLTFPMGLGAVGMWLGYLPWMALTGVFFLWRFLRKTSPLRQNLYVDRTNRRSPRETGLVLIAWAALLLLFWRALSWLASTALVREQVGHAAVVLIFGLVFLLRDRPGGNPLELRFGRRAVQFYIGAIVSAGLAALLHEPLPMLCGLGFLAGAVLLFVLGDAVFRPALGFGLAFTGFTALSILFPFADWPLRVLAGKMAAWFLGLLGNPAQLGFTGEPLRLVLVSGGRPFEVAPECNGFGIISGCLLLALLLAFSRRLRVVDKLMILVLAPLLGLISNALRIFLIVLLAPMAGDHYAIMHEAVGIALFFGTLAFVWWLVAGLPERVR